MVSEKARPHSLGIGSSSESCLSPLLAHALHETLGHVTPHGDSANSLCGRGYSLISTFQRCPNKEPLLWSSWVYPNNISSSNTLSSLFKTSYCAWKCYVLAIDGEIDGSEMLSNSFRVTQLFIHLGSQNWCSFPLYSCVEDLALSNSWMHLEKHKRGHWVEMSSCI